MGWKAVRDHYRITHIVQVTDAGLCIGSPYIHDLIVISLSGEILKADGWGNTDLARYATEMKADPKTLRDVVVAPDTFAISLPVFTYEGAEIIEKRCEAYGWPNITHDGHIMHKNTYSADRDLVVEWAKRSCLSRIEWTRELVSEKQADLTETQGRLDRYLADAHALGVKVSDGQMSMRAM
jgi:hypothetical protein